MLALEEDICRLEVVMIAAIFVQIMQRHCNHAKDPHNLIKTKRLGLFWCVPFLNIILEISLFFNALNKTHLV
jgi:hypothetical protein